MSQLYAESQNASILVVDDTHENLRLLSQILSEDGYHVRPVSNGSRALSAANAKPPDLVLLDIMMPDMDGYAVCRHLKANTSTRDIPVIFISALNDVVDKVKGFRLGAVDYITKPFEAEDVLSRVKTHVGLRLMQRQLSEQNRQLQQEIAERKRAEAALQEANATKNTFFSILAHDLRSPFSSVLGSIEIALTYFDQLTPEELQQHIVRIKKSAEVFYALLENLLTWARIQRGRMEYQPENIPLHDLVEHLLDLFASPAEQKKLVLERDVPHSLSVYADINMLNTILRNLVSNALKFTPERGRINLTAMVRDGVVEIVIADTGIGITDVELADLLRIDRKTTTLGTGGEHGTGLGLPLCQDLAKMNHGHIHLESTPGQGTTITVSMPAAAPVSESSSKPHLNAPHDEHVIQLMRRMPAEWLSQVLNAVGAFNLTQTKKLTETIFSEHPELADALTYYADQFQFETLQALCQRAQARATNLSE